MTGLLVAACGVVSVAVPAQAEWAVECSGQASSLTVRGAVLVPDNASCVLDHVTVTGEVTVGPGATLIATDSVFQSSVRVRSDGWFDALRSRVDQSVLNTDGFGVSLVDSRIAGSYEAQGEQFFPFVDLTGSTVGGSIEVRAGLVELTGSRVGGGVLSSGSDYTDVHDSIIDGEVRVDGNAFGSLFCTSEVYGGAVFTSNQRGVQLGGAGRLGDCGTGAGYWDGDVTVTGTSGGVEVVNNIVRGNLAGTGNDPAPTGAGNRVRGAMTGQFASLPAGTPAAAARSAEVGKRDATETEQRQRRTAAGKTADMATGPALLTGGGREYVDQDRLRSAPR